MKKNFRILSAVLTVCMLLTLIPVSALAADEEHVHSYTETVLKAQTCTETGVKKLTCSCGDVKYEIIPLHTYGEGAVTEPATCGKDGVMTYTCTVCQATKTEVIPATGEHNYEDAIVEATCTAPAMAGEVCTVCGAANGELTVIEGSEPLGHDFVLNTEDEDYVAATCTEPGVNTYKCSRCEETKTEEAPATGHSWDVGVLVDDCEGQYVLYTCTKCSETMKEYTGLGEVREHEWEETGRTEATCTEPGAIIYTCKVCHNQKTEEITALGHDMVDTVVPATCQAEGYTKHECSRCDYTEENTDITPIDPNGHVYGSSEVLKAPTCTVAGVQKNICALCGASMGYESIAPAHTWNAGEETKPATCTEDGEMTYTCTVCQATKTEAIPAAHSWDAGVTTKEATCGADGEKTFTCTVCEETKTEAIPATGLHNFAEDILDATCTEPAMAGEICTVCGAVNGELQAVEGSEPLGHDFQLDTSLEGYKPATCTEGGLDTFKCSRCEATKTEETAATGHKWDVGTLVDDCEGQYVLYTCQNGCGETMKEYTGLGEVREHEWKETGKEDATCTEPGEITYTCTFCGKVRTEEITALGHDVVDTVVPATCKAEGYTKHECSRCDYTEENTDITPIDPNAHVAGEGVVLKEPTRDTAGVKKNVCALCGASMGYVSIPPLGIPANEIFTLEEFNAWGESFPGAYSVGWRYAESFDTNTITELSVAIADADGNIILAYTASGEQLTYQRENGYINANGQASTSFYQEYNGEPIAEGAGDDWTIAKGPAFDQWNPAKAIITVSVGDKDYTQTNENCAHTHTYEVTNEVAGNCGVAGEKTYTCTGCGHTYTEEIPATGEHSFEEGVRPATCTEPAKAGMICTVCGAVDGELTVVDGSEPLGHDFQLDTSLEGYKPATCTEGGLDTFKCSRCDATETKETAAIGHKWDNGLLVDDCEGQYVLYTCENCSETMKEYTGLGEVREHEWEETGREDATCTEAGEITYTCKLCGKVRTEEITALGHDMVDTVVPATCQAEGYTKHECSRCDYTEENTDITPIDPNGHVAGEGVILRAPTCTEPGVKKNVCALCGASMGYVSMAPEHTWDEGEITTPATCTEAGEKTFTCTECEATKTEVVPATGHDYGEGEVTKEPTCGAAGERTFTCSACSDSYTEEIPATGEHHYVDDYVLEATCTEPMKVGRICDVCGAVDGEVTELGEPAGHKYEEEITKEPTCTEEGEATYTCSVCSDSYTEAVPAAGHKWNDGEILEADCENGQRVLYTCTECDATRTEETGLVEALGHDMVATTVPATCTTEGYTTSKCTRCGKETEKTDITPIDPNTHTFDYDNAYVLREATCATPGVIRVTCTGCGKTVYQEKTVEHTWNEGEVTKDPTCTEAGEVTYTCTVCGATKVDTVEPAGHIYGPELVDEDNTYVYHVCTVCGHEEIIASLVDCEHETQLQNAKEATCEEDGYTGDQVCTKCGETIEEGEVIPALGHSTELQNAKEATCEEDGYTGDQVCTRCGETIEEGEVIPALGHSTELQNAKEATCEEDGYTGDQVCTKCGETIEAGEVIPAIGHDYVQSGPIYSEDYSTYWYTYTCSHCGHSYNSDPVAS